MTIERKVGMGIAGQPAGGAANVADVFSTYLYTGTNATKNIVNGIDLAGEGGMVWTKTRGMVGDHLITDSEATSLHWIRANTTGAVGNYSSSYGTVFNSDGFTLKDNLSTNNYSGAPTASWTFRKARKFFDVVTWTGNSTSGREISHSLGGEVGMMVVKCTSNASTWAVYHKSLGGTKYVTTNTTAGSATYLGYWNDTAPTSSVFTLGNNSDVNYNGRTYVAYLFADNSAEDADDQMIKCGSVSGAGEVNLGWEPQYILYKRTDSTGNWYITDTMRGMAVGGDTAFLYANTSAAESSGGGLLTITSTGFTHVSAGSNIYMAIRAPMMKEPESGTEVFTSGVYSGGGGQLSALSTTMSTDLFMVTPRSGVTNGAHLITRMLGYKEANGDQKSLSTHSTAAETSNEMWSFAIDKSDNQDKFKCSQDSSGNWAASGSTYATYAFKRAKGFFDCVAYSGTGATNTQNHSLSVPPELIIIKARNIVKTWSVYNSFSASGYRRGNLDTANDMGVTLRTYETDGNGYGIARQPTATDFQLEIGSSSNGSGNTHIAYLFATLDGISKVGSYTGNGTNQTIDCGFAAGARFILIRRTGDDDGDWYIWDTTRGIVAGNDPHLSLNTTAAEVSDDSIDPANSGFIVNQVSATNINVSSGTYIYLAIA